MADPANNAGAGGTGSGAKAQPAAQPQTPAAAAPVTTSHGAPPEVTQEFDKAFGGASKPQWTDTALPADTKKTAPAPSPDGHAAPGTSEEDAAASKEQPKPGETPADDLTSPFKKLAINLDGKAAGDTTGKAVPTTDVLPADNDALMKRVNPDGQRTDVEQRDNAIKVAQEAQSAIGRQGAEVAEARKVQAALKELESVFTLDKESGRFKPTPQGVLTLADALPQEAIQAALAERGAKLVPLNWQPANPEQNEADADFDRALNEVIPGDELTAEEKAQELQGNPRLQGLLSAKLVKYNLQRGVSKLAADQGIQQRTQKTQQQQEKTLTEFADNLKKIPYWKELEPALKHWNQTIPWDKPLSDTLRNEIMYRLSELNRVPDVMAKAVAAAKEQAKQEVMAQIDLGGLPDGQVPTWVPPGKDKSPEDAATDATAKRMKQELANV